MNDSLGKDAEARIRTWLDRPEDGYSFDRFFDQMTGFYQTSRNICDFVVFKQPYCYYIESKATWADRFDFSLIQPHQLEGLIEKDKIAGCFGWIIVLFATYQRAFCFKAIDIKGLSDAGTKSLNILKIDKWRIPYKEIQTIPNSRKRLLDYTGEIENLI